VFFIKGRHISITALVLTHRIKSKFVFSQDHQLTFRICEL